MARALHFLVAALAVGACGDDDRDDVDVSAVERGLARVVEQQTATRDVSVDCPDDVDEGDLCGVSAPGGLSAEIRVTRLGDPGEIEGEVVQP